jgi:phosphopantothenate---cysteine ligase (ATP)
VSVLLLRVRVAISQSTSTKCKSLTTPPTKLSSVHQTSINMRSTTPAEAPAPAAAEEEEEATGEETVTAFLANLPNKEELELELAQFVVHHASHQRPIALVTSGGTAADLEVNSVRSLDNFSTGLRGAISVEEFLRRGYAVIHLWRRGSAAPFARVLSQCLGLSQANHGLTVDSLGKLFVGDHMLEGNNEEALVQQVLDQEDPWLTQSSMNSTTTTATTAAAAAIANNNGRQATCMTLHRHILYSTKLQKALQERSQTLKEQRLLTIPFRSVEEYLTKLQLAATALQDSSSLALCYLAAAVSDYYIPHALKSQHKIQSREGGNEAGITLQLHPVPKTMALLRTKWAPQAFLVSFKLETDKDILRRKAEQAVQKYACHLVIGNLLQTRHSQVWILSPGEANTPTDVWPFTSVSCDTHSSQDSLESAIIDFVVQAHFEFISNQGYSGKGLESAERRQTELLEKKRLLQRQAFAAQMKQQVWTIGGMAIAVVLSSVISSVLQRRYNPSSR